MSAFFCIPVILLQSICRADRELEICHRVTPPRLPNGRYCIKNPKTKTEKKDFKCLSSTVVDFTKNASLRGVKSEITGILQNDESLFWIIFLESAV